MLEFISHKDGESLVFIRINACIADSTGTEDELFYKHI